MNECIYYLKEILNQIEDKFYKELHLGCAEKATEIINQTLKENMYKNQSKDI